MRIGGLALFAGVVMGGMLVEATAEACSFGGCIPGQVIPSAPNVRVPGNLPGFLFVPPQAGWGAPQPPELEVIELVAPNGQKVPSTLLPSGVFAPDAPLAPGMYKLRFRECSSLGLADAGTIEHPVEVIAAVPMPTGAGTLKVTTELGTAHVWTYRGSCTVDLDASLARLAVEPSSELAPWLPLVRWSVAVDGQPWKGPHKSLFGPDANDALTVFTACADADPGEDTGVAPGPHHVAVTGTIIGVPQALPALEADITLTCPGGTPAPSVRGTDDASVDPGFGGTERPPSDAAATFPLLPSGASPDSGCSAASASLGSAGPFAGLALACGALFATRRRRRT